MDSASLRLRRGRAALEACRLTWRLRQQQQQHSGPLSQLTEMALPLLWATPCDEGARAFRLGTKPARGRQTLIPDDGHGEGQRDPS